MIYRLERMSYGGHGGVIHSTESDRSASVSDMDHEALMRDAEAMYTEITKYDCDSTNDTELLLRCLETNRVVYCSHDVEMRFPTLTQLAILELDQLIGSLGEHDT